MSKKPPDLSWQDDYIREYKRTSGLGMSFGPAEPGGWYTATIQSSVDPSPHAKRFRRGEAVANTERLRTRPDHGTERASA